MSRQSSTHSNRTSGRLIRAIMSLLAVGAVLSSCGSSGKLDDPSSKGRELVTEFMTLLSTPDSPDLDGFLAEGFQIQRADGSHATKDEFLADHALVTAFTITDDLTAVQDGDVLTVRWSVVADESIAGVAQGTGEKPRLSVFVRRDDEWKMVAHANFNLAA